MAPAPASRHTPHTPLGRVAGIAVLLAALVSVVVLAFSWPAITAEPRDIPVAIAGPEQAVTALSAQLGERSDDLFGLQPVADRDAAVDAIRTRDAVGAIVLGESPELLTASAAGASAAVVRQLAEPLQGALAAQAQAASAASGQPVAPPTLVVTDVVPFAENDANGLGMNAAFFPLLLGGMIGGIAISLLVVGSFRRVLGVVVYAVVGGVALTGILQGWFGALQGDYWLNTAAFTLALAAIAAPIVGFVALIGRAGIAVGPVVMMLFANPISGAALPASYLPGSWGAIGQWFPPGASATLVRNLSYFPDADASGPWLVLAAWAVGGLLLAVIGHFRTAGGAEPDAEAARLPAAA
ncbi:hypothetical protein [Microbacterium sp. No. 7]|uniref:hypothetical protein n=1 Tax=Microbacterium sp. No. 7 TaxID=1714373 RepID=UPI0006D2B423|nr:hypothetical protein [Microbacterium sp. No. 7]ALJ18690.1 hypothetical protein AOA12_01670 [Microbacterium sp. No. 7]